MKNYAFKLMLLMALLIFLGCSSDNSSQEPECETILCKNGGAFSDSTCQCDCLQGYTGNDCFAEIPPSKVIIEKAFVKAFPNTNNGSDWDDILIGNDRRPDIFITIENLNSDVLYDSPIYYANAFSDGVTVYEFDVNLQIMNYDNLYKINIIDYDSLGAYQTMETDYFFAYFSGLDFPNIITIENAAKEIIIDLQVSYQW